MEAGLAVTFLEAPLIAQERNTIPDTIAEQCQELSIPVSGNAAGHSDIADFAGWTLGPYQQNNGWHSKGIGAMAGCVLTAVLGMLTVVWYALGGHISEEDMEHEVRQHQEAKARRGKLFGLIKPKN